MKLFLILISFLLLSNSNVIHKDAQLQIDKNGNITGLPKDFTPAKFNLNKQKLRINNKEIQFPKCLNHYFLEHKNPRLSLSASWYHSKSIIPYYLNFDISDNSANYKYNIIVNLETLELIRISKSIKKETGTGESEIELDKKCLTKYKNRIKNLN